MREIVFDTGKTLISFKIDKTTIEITDLEINNPFIVNPKTFDEQIKSERSLMMYRRKKGEKEFILWKKDLEKFKNFTTEKEVVEDIYEDFHKKKGFKIIKDTGEKEK